MMNDVMEEDEKILGSKQARAPLSSDGGSRHPLHL